MMRICFVIAVCLAATQLAASENWSKREICRAATKVYFFLSDLPKDAADKSFFMGFLSSTGNYYFCRLDGLKAEFMWRDASGEEKSSSVTTFEVSGSALMIKSDLQSETFQSE